MSVPVIVFWVGELLPLTKVTVGTGNTGDTVKTVFSPPILFLSVTVAFFAPLSFALSNEKVNWVFSLRVFVTGAPFTFSHSEPPSKSKPISMPSMDLHPIENSLLSEICILMFPGVSPAGAS